MKGCLQFRLLLFQLRQTVRLLLHLGLDGLGLGQLAGVLLGLAHQHADLLAEGIAVGAQLVCLRNGGPALGVQVNDLVHQGQLGILELFLDIFLDGFGIFPNKSNVQHGVHLKINVVWLLWYGGRGCQAEVAPPTFHVKQNQFPDCEAPRSCSARASYRAAGEWGSSASEMASSQGRRPMPP